MPISRIRSSSFVLCDGLFYEWVVGLLLLLLCGF